jgi:hypothetical protein
MILLTACDGGPVVRSDAGVEPPLILEVRAPSPALEGSLLEVRAVGLDVYDAPPRLELLRGDGTFVAALDAAPDDDSTDGTLLFELSSETVSVLGDGVHPLDVRTVGDGPASDLFPTELRLVTTLPVELSELPSGNVFRNEVAVVGGAGIVSATEGTITARFVGTFTPDSGGSTPLDVSLPVAPLSRGERERGVVVLTTDLGGLQPGTFDGTIQLDSTLRSGDTSQSSALPTTLRFTPPALFGLDPTEAALGQILRVSGGGFLGGPDRPTEGTSLRLEGTFTPAGGGTPEPFPATDLVPRFVSGAEVLLEIEAEVRGEALVSALFGHARGTFTGTATPITSAGTEELTGAAQPFAFQLGALRQVVHLRFLPGFYDSLRRFGLASAAPEIIDRVKERMEGIYEGWNVEVRLEEPDDFGPNAYTVIEIGGPDPNGAGLFGYDNTPGKDIGNVRLFDRIGGANAQTQTDGYPGYGGVFVDSILFWSSHPDLPGETPSSGPDPDPLFDEVFDPVRMQPATRAEVGGDGDPTRVAQVRRAVRALGGIIGETSAHELGHSLGMAQPYGPPTTYHNDFDADGCLMDTGRDRPLGERMEESGFAPSELCHEQPSYLDEILGM